MEISPEQDRVSLMDVKRFTFMSVPQRNMTFYY